jgi:Glycosyltransferase family 28 C-terminal domain
VRVLFYALGGGSGHFCRSQAVARAFHKTQDSAVRVLCPDRFGSWSDPAFQVHSPTQIDRESLRAWVAEQLDDFQPNLLVVDVFPRGVLGELPNLNGLHRVLVTRWVHPQYYRRPEVSEALASYDQIFSSEPQEIDVTVERVLPIVWTQCGVSRSEARKALGGNERPLVVALGSGPPEAQEQLESRLQKHSAEADYQLAFFSPKLGPSVPEIGRYLHGADLVVSAAGYQSYYETLQSGVPAIFLPQRRRYDNQAARALGRFGPPQNAECAVARNPSELASLISRLLKSPRQKPISFSGAQEIVHRVLGARVDSLQ